MHTRVKVALWIFGALVILGIIGSLSDRQRQAPTVGKAMRITDDNLIGCSDRDYFEKLVRYAADNDREAWSKGLLAGVAIGKCTTFKADEPVFIADTAISHGLVKLRRQGDLLEYWTQIEAVR